MVQEELQSALESHGEVIITMDSGQEYELHLGNTEIEDGRIFVDAITTEYFLDASKVESYYLHYDV